MKNLENIFDHVDSITKKGKCLIVKSNNEMYVLKEKNSDLFKIYSYLESRNFDYFPKVVIDNDKYNIYEYIDSSFYDNDEKALNMINILSLLHNKTTYYKEIDINEYKDLYEEISNRINSIDNYYLNLINKIETKVFMSPSEYLIARNISKFFEAINYSRNKLNDWYDLIKTVSKKRMVLLYNNIDINHVIKNKNIYLINWDKAKMGLPFYDIYNFYKKYALNFDFNELFKYYEDRYPLLNEERELLFVLLTIPDYIENGSNELECCKNAKRVIDYIYKTEVFITNNDAIISK